MTSENWHDVNDKRTHIHQNEIYPIYIIAGDQISLMVSLWPYLNFKCYMISIQTSYFSCCCNWNMNELVKSSVCELCNPREYFFILQFIYIALPNKGSLAPDHPQSSVMVTLLKLVHFSRKISLRYGLRCFLLPMVNLKC